LAGFVGELFEVFREGDGGVGSVEEHSVLARSGKLNTEGGDVGELVSDLLAEVGLSGEIAGDVDGGLEDFLALDGHVAEGTEGILGVVFRVHGVLVGGTLARGLDGAEDSTDGEILHSGVHLGELVLEVSLLGAVISVGVFVVSFFLSTDGGADTLDDGGAHVVAFILVSLFLRSVFLELSSVLVFSSSVSSSALMVERIPWIMVERSARERSSPELEVVLARVETARIARP